MDLPWYIRNPFPGRDLNPKLGPRHVRHDPHRGRPMGSAPGTPPRRCRARTGCGYLNRTHIEEVWPAVLAHLDRSVRTWPMRVRVAVTVHLNECTHLYPDGDKPRGQASSPAARETFRGALGGLGPYLPARCRADVVRGEVATQVRPRPGPMLRTRAVPVHGHV
jgi:hypothetical protein